jgi:tetratricopeptide (TPR) repeat protein
MVNDVNHPIYKKTAEEYLLEGNQNYHKGEFKKAIEAYKKAIEIKPDEDTFVISYIIIRINLNGFFIGFNCLFKLI